MKHVAVIGAGFGDEGKGQLVDYFASSGDYSTVIRFNGGSQAGHTVVTPDNNRHVFSQLGSGSFVGLPTHLSKFMLVNPIFLMKEIDVFSKFETVNVSIDWQANIILPWDVEVNRTNLNNHGSVGHGVNQAVRRSYNPEYAVTAFDIYSWGCNNSIDKMIECLDKCEKYYSSCLDINYRNNIRESIQEAFIHAVQEFHWVVNLANTRDIIKNSCIFEGAQGLLLDQNSGFFPHVTPSNTGLTNVMNLIDNRDIVTPVYVSRSFLTRHGEGPLYYDWCSGIELNDDSLHDPTNVYNPFQKYMRYGTLSIPQLKFAINKDYSLAKQIRSHSVNLFELAMTWANIETDYIKSNELIDKLGIKYFATNQIRTFIYKT